MSNVFNIADRPGRDMRLLDQARDAAIPPLVDAFAMALGRFDDALFDRAERAGPSQMAFLDAMRELRRRREDIVVRFRAHLQRAWKALQEGQPLSMETAFAQGVDDTLTLVTDQELESRLAVRNLASVIQRDCKPVLLRLDRRLGWIAGDVALDSDLNPIGPEHIGVAVHQAFSACDLTPEVRLVVIKLCERDLVPAIARIYAALDQRLGGGTAPEPAARRASRPEAARELEDLIADEEPGAPAWAARFLNRMAGVNRGLQAAHAGAQSPGFGEVPPGYASAPGAQGVLLEALHHLLQESRRGRDVQDEAPRPAHPQRDLSQREMLSVLSLLQSSPSATLRAAIGDTGESLSQRLKNEVLSSAMQLGVDPATARLAPVDEDAIDLVGMLFDVMLDERDLEGRPRELIGRLVVPFVKVALLDRRMFVQKTHPARRLLNVLAEACEGNNGESAAERTLLTKVEEVIDRLVAEFNENLAIFLTLEEEFRAFLEQHRRTHRDRRTPGRRDPARPGAPGSRAHAHGRRAGRALGRPPRAAGDRGFPAPAVGPPRHHDGAARGRGRRGPARITGAGRRAAGRTDRSAAPRDRQALAAGMAARAAEGVRQCRPEPGCRRRGRRCAA